MDLVQKQASVQEPSVLLLANASELIRIGCKSDLACLLGCIKNLNKQAVEKQNEKKKEKRVPEF